MEEEAVAPYGSRLRPGISRGVFFIVKGGIYG